MSDAPKRGWTDQQLNEVGNAEELQIATRRKDASLRQFITIWVVRMGDSIYVRSAHGPENSWYRRALASGRGRIRAGGVEADIDITAAADADQAAIDAAYHDKYDRYGAQIVRTVTGPDVTQVTLRLTPSTN